MAEKNKPFRILVVDDELGPREALKFILTPGVPIDGETHPIALRTAQSGVEALEQLRQEPCELVLSDIRMPGMSGIELLEAIRVSYRDIPVVLLTGYATGETAQQALKMGACDFISKPYNVRDIRELVARVIQQTGKESKAPVAPQQLDHAPARPVPRRPLDRDIYPYVVGGLLHDSLNTLWTSKTNLETLQRRAQGVELPEAFLSRIERTRASLEHLEAVLRLVQALSREYYAPTREPSEGIESRVRSLVEMQAKANPDILYKPSLDDLSGVELPLPIAAFIAGELLANATKACSSGSGATIRLRLRVSPRRDELVIRCSDSGPGFAEPLLARIREGSLRPKREASTGGYGLYLIHEIAARLGGGLRAANQPDGGAQVEVVLPMETGT
ncbi:MAG: response regulator [Lentisphaeria bacterium]|nr:response regulator [Lentisphaeria bacterium]